ncbi:MAG: prolipoprotein diacylglyceryl transferase family protein [Pirellulales bacterium]
MYDVLFHIPHQVAGWPVFGWGLVAGVWLIVGGLWLVVSLRRPAAAGDWLGSLMLFGLGTVAFVWLAPRMEDVDPLTQQRLGIAIHGYGVLVTLGVVSGVGLAIREGRRMGLNPELTYALAMRLFVAGILGARAFYVALNWDDFRRPHLSDTLLEVVKFTEGGLVVYGSFLAALVVGGLFLWQRRLPVLAMADLAAPAMLLGLAFGRVGCFLHGCCFGGECAAGPLAVTFPENSPPYYHQWQRGRMHGMKLGPAADGTEIEVLAVDPDGPAAAAGLQPGERVRMINGVEVDTASRSWFPAAADGLTVELVTSGGQTVRWRAAALPPRSRPVHPVQLYSSASAAALALLLWAWYPWRRRDGELMAGLMVLYPVSRILEEAVRDDEPGRWGTPLTISQWVSVGVLLAGVALWWYVLRQPLGCRRFSDAPSRPTEPAGEANSASTPAAVRGRSR